MARNVNYDMDHSGFRDLAKSQGIGAAMKAAADAGAKEAERRAPRRSGTFAQSFQARQVEVVGGRRNEKRAGAVVENTAPHAPFVRGRDGRNFMQGLIPYIEGLGRR